MNSTLSFNASAAKRVLYFILAVVFLSSALPLLQAGKASAAQLSLRSITLSDSANSGTSVTTGEGSGTNVSYQVSFKSIAQASSMVIDFCAEDPIVNDTCTTPTGMNASAATLTNTGSVGTVGVAADNWTATAAAGQVKLADDAVSAHDIQPNTVETFQLNGITNPSTVGTFYARLYTFTNATYGTYVNSTSAGNFKDYGGIALSTTAVITVTARVQEQITFCVTKADPNTWTTTGDCSDPVVGNPSNLPAITLGHGSPTPVLDATATDTGSIWTQLSTNATHGAVIYLHNSNTTCGGLSADNGATCAIPPVNAGLGTGASALPAGTAAFGMYDDTYTPTVGVGTIGSVTPAAEYHNGAHTPAAPPTWYGMDTTTSGNNVTSTYGSTVATTTLPVYRADNIYIFGATAALNTPAGIYTANLNLVATGTF